MVNEILIRAPNGELYYGKNISNNNPYILNKIRNNRNNSNTNLVELNEITISLDENELQNAVDLTNRSFYVKIFCFIDIMINIYFVFIIPDLYIQDIFFLFLSFYGYVSAHSYNIYGILFYLIYKYFIFLVGISYILMSLYVHNMTLFKNIYYSLTINLLLIYHFSVTYYTQMFYNKILKIN